MYTNTSHKEGVAIIARSCGIDTDSAPQPEKEFTTLMGEGDHKILLNFSEVTFISSGGLRVLHSTVKKITDPYVKFRFCCVHPVVKILKLTGVTKIFTIISSEGDTLDAWR